MESFLRLWPVLAYLTGLFFGGLGLAVGLTMWIMRQLIYQDKQRDDAKKEILKEVRDRHHALLSAMDMRQAMTTEAIEELKDKIAALDKRTVVVETLIRTNSHFPRDKS